MSDLAIAMAILAQRRMGPLVDRDFVKQSAFVLDKSRYISAQCSRRAGKTNGLAFRFINTMAKHPNSLCPYIALTRTSAENIMWPVLQEIDEKYKIGLHFSKSDLSCYHPNGAKMQLFGADMQNFIRRLRGIKAACAGIDEVQDFGPHIESLIDDVLTPAISDIDDSWLALTGTPGPIPQGYFFDVTAQGKFGYSVHKWTVLDNPYMPNAEAFIEDLKRKKGWDEFNPTLLREWRNQWVLDVESLLIKYSEAQNHYDSLPPGKWVYILGVDIGLRDADALAVLAWSEATANIYLVEEIITTDQDITGLTSQIEHLQNKYDIAKIVMDEGGLGKKVAEEIRRRKHIPVQPADKARKMENVAFLNDWLRQGKFKAPKNSRFAKDSYMVQIDWEHTTPDRIKVKDTFHSDIIDAVLYAFKESPAFTYRDPKPVHKYLTPEWAAEEVTKMERDAEEYFKRQEEQESIETEWGW